MLERQRGSGKSSILKLLIRKLSPKDGWLYLNFEDPYFLEHNQPQIIEELLETKINYLNEVSKYLFFDEIQNINQWESVVRKLRDSGKYKIFVTGSSSKLLSRELSSLISGRHLSHTLYPLSFGEFLSFRQIEIKNKKDLILQEKFLLKNFFQYLLVGGYPEIVLTENQELVKQYYQDIIQRDIIKRYDIREKELLEKMGVFLITNSGRTVSSRSLSRQY
ncbi:AAA family ATPase, partial [Candidatus Gottesmanbacteria bacterium]|nr:AAA family ATPase [Candidatus Gottesmanbacteria bacterium]